MIISLITAWIATICVILTAVKYFTKKSKSANRLLRKIHIPLGIVLILAGLIHGIFAGNALGSSLGDAYIAPVLFTLNMGTVCFVLTVLLGLSYLFRKSLKRRWMTIHRVLTILLVVAVVIHIVQMGITLPTALSSLGQETVTEEPVDNTEEIQENTESLVTFSGAVLQDGVYEGSAQGYQSTITVSVTVESGAVTDIEVLSENDTPKYFNRAIGVIDSILNDQTLEVDGISGATISSRGIQNAVYDALQEAVVSGTLNITEIQVSNAHMSGGKPR